jgi:hypothetical protein
MRTPASSLDGARSIEKASTKVVATRKRVSQWRNCIADRKRPVRDRHRRAAFDYLTAHELERVDDGIELDVPLISRRITPLLPDTRHSCHSRVIEERQCDGETNDPGTDYVTLV